MSDLLDTLERVGCYWEDDEKATATKYLNETCGTLHLSWVLDHYWGLVTEKVILPAAHIIYDKLVEKDFSEKNKSTYGDADGHIFFIPSPNKKVWVHTTQSRDYLYIISNDSRLGSEWQDLHIRRIYREYDGTLFSKKELISSMDKAIENAEFLMECHDDHYKYSSRCSLEAYRKINFKIPFSPKDHMKEVSHYGDFRDNGYILSYNGWRAKTSHPTVEGAKMAFTDLEVITNCYLPSVASDLEVSVPGLRGYGSDENI